MKKALIYSISILLIGAAIIFFAEGEEGGSLSTFVQSIWWSFTTIVTGSFADIYNPTTATGMVLTVILVFAGMVLVGIFTATLTSIMIGDEREANIDTLRVYMEARLTEIDIKIDKFVGKEE